LHFPWDDHDLGRYPLGSFFMELGKVVELYEQRHGIVVDEASFLDRQMETHNYDLTFNLWIRTRPQDFVYVNMLADKLFLYRCITRKQKVKNPPMEGGTTLINCDEKLPLLRVFGSTQCLWFDENLYKVYTHRNNALRKQRKVEDKKKREELEGLMSYREILEELGADPVVQDIWGRELKYKSDIARRTPHQRRPKRLFA